MAYLTFTKEEREVVPYAEHGDGRPDSNLMQIYDYLERRTQLKVNKFIKEGTLFK